MSSDKILSDIKNLNKDIVVDKDRNMYLKKLLEQNKGLMGVIISKPTGKCVGTIENSGKMNHTDGDFAKSPYNIVVKSNELNIQNMLMKNDLHGLPAHEIVLKIMNLPNVRILGQTVDMQGKIVGLILRMDKTNNYIQTQKDDPLPNIPILAILQKTKTAPDVGKPTAPDAGKPTAPDAGKPTAPDAGKPTAPDAGKPTAPDAGKPTAPSAIAPTCPPPTAPTAPSAGKPMMPTCPPPPAASKAVCHPIKSSDNTSKLAPKAEPLEDCVEPVDCKAEPVGASSSVSGSPAPATDAGAMGSSSMSSKMSNFWHSLPIVGTKKQL
jgi:hypothetical protein